MAQGRLGASMDDRVLEEIRFHQDVVNKDASSPLFQIREKEMEISGRVLAAHGQADKLLAEARQQAAELVEQTRADAEAAARARALELAKESEQEAARLREEAIGQAAALREHLGEHHDQAVEFVIRAVTAS